MTAADFRVLIDQGALSPIAQQFSEFVVRHAGGEDCDLRLRLAAALASQAVVDSHVCVALPRLYEGGEGWYPVVADDGDQQVRLPELADWLAFLRDDGRCRQVVGRPADAEAEGRPLVLDDEGRLYLHRYYLFEQRLAASLRAMAQTPPALQMSADTDHVRETLTRLLGAADVVGWETNWPKVAAFAALRQRLTVITGGPGTGKTSVVGRLLVLLRELCAPEKGGAALRIRLAAPTGKAAARLSQGLEECLAELVADGAEGLDDLQLTASTLHRLLGSVPNSIRFRHNADNPIDADLVIVDEASMVTLPQMVRLVEAVRPGARLILLGDMKQLASVESGFVLGDLCEAMGTARFSAAFRRDFAEIATAAASDAIPMTAAAVDELGDCCVELTYSWRFRPGSHVDRVSAAVNRGDGAAALAELPGDGSAAELTDWRQQAGVLAPLSAAAAADWDADHRTVVTHRRDVPAVLLRNGRPDPVLAATGYLQARYADFLAATDPAAALAAFKQFRILCATRWGPHGVVAFNQLVEALLGVPVERGRDYDHRPILITENSYGLDLFNGDTGVMLHNPDYDAEAPAGTQLPRLLAYFPAISTGEAPRFFVPEVLPAHETAWAMTIHKSQGSQFDDVLVVLPHRDNPVVGRELIYTGITRAKRRAELWLPPDRRDRLFQQWARRATDRHSGLVQAMRGGLR